ncbi:MAG: hypothetical protein O7C67_17400 [Gammaproteobacteria bacterium]|nr:hypothetical protein [Gammaproteobacteria bacterium]
MYVCTGGFVNTQTTSAECTAALECPALTDPPDDVPPITDAVDPNVPPGMSCRPRNVWRPDLGEYTTYNVCSPSESIASSDDDGDDDHKPAWTGWNKHGDRYRGHRNDN